MLKIDRRRLLATARATGWDLEGHVRHVYNRFRFRAGKPPPITCRRGETRLAIQQSLMDWNADLGARDRMNWRGFLRRHQDILKRLTELPRLGRLDDSGLDEVCGAVAELEVFKRTAGRKLVFGSKVAHFHFPWLVPVMSSEVQEGLIAIQRNYRPDLDEATTSTTPFRFSSPANRMASYRRYVTLGNALMRDVDTRALLGRRCSAKYDLHAKVFEWWVISFSG